MRDLKSKLKDDIITDARNLLTSEQITILESIIVKHLQPLSITEETTALATPDNTNEYVINLFRTVKSQKLSPKTIEAYILTVRLLTRYVNKPITTMTANDIEYFLGQIAATNSARSLDNNRRNLSAFFGFMRKKRLIFANPVEEVEAYNVPDKKIEYLNPEQMDAIKDNCINNKERALVEFWRCTGLRIGELINVKVSDIEWKTGKVSVYATKTSEYRTVYIDDICQKHLLKYLNERGAVFSSDQYLFEGDRSKTRMQASCIRDDLKRLGARTNMVIYPHLFRKTVATNILKRGGSVIDAGDYLGHKDRTTAGMHYAFKGEEHIFEIFNRYVKAV